MATLLLGAAGGVIGGALFGPIGAIAGRALGALGGAVLDQTLIGGARSGTTVTGARLADLDVMTSSAGGGVPRVYGRARLGGQVIWATQLEEVASVSTTQSGGKSTSQGAAKTTTITYLYYASFALALCEGPVSRIGRMWADGKPLDLTGITVRTYHGWGDQPPDPWIEAKQGAGNTPAYRGLAYVVFERLPLANYGNRLPQITVEVERAVGQLEQQVRAVTLIPGATEFGYEPRLVQRVTGLGAYAPENRHAATAPTDLAAALDQLQAQCPRVRRVSLVITWFGSDLRAGACRIEPKVERADKETSGATWMVGSLTRADAATVSWYGGSAAYGGTPSDESIIGAIQTLQARGLEVTLNPFVMMDIPAGNTLPDPWSGGITQAAYPWRGRITCHPAPGVAGSPDGTAEAEAQVDALFGHAQAGDFTRFGTMILYAGPDEWSLRRMVLHYAVLARDVGGVEALLIGSELAALTRVRGPGGSFPAAARLAALAADAKAVVGAGTKVSYGANWDEYGAQAFADGTVAFPLDELWAAPAVDFVGIDHYAPLADWRDGAGHLDLARARSIYDRAYLKGNLRGGENYDWYYASEAARAAQARTPITDGAYGEPWVFRQKDLWSWWGLGHFPRPGGVRAASPTAWVPGSKPIRLMETGCGAVDKGPNRPSTFPDAKSSEGGFPPFSNRSRDDLAQRRMLEAVTAAFDPAFGASAADNPPAGVAGGYMVDPIGIYLWTWDARPFPHFPLATAVWADGANWETGHWLTGRLATAPLDGLVAAICADHGLADIETDRLEGVVDGYVVDQPMSARAAIEPLARAFAFDAAEEGARLLFRPRGAELAASLTEDDLLMQEDAAPLSLTRAQESELPLEVQITFGDGGADFRRSTVSSRRLAGASRHVARAEVAVMASDAVMVRAADTWLQDLWAGREQARFALPLSRLALQPGDMVDLTCDGRTRRLEITEISDGAGRAVTARSIDPSVFRAPLGTATRGAVALPAAFGPPFAQVLDLPALDGTDPPILQYLAAGATPWPSTLAVWRSSDGASFSAVAAVRAPATVATLLDDLAPGPLWRFDRSTRLRVRLVSGALVGRSEAEVLERANALALVADGRAPEILQFTEAALLESGVYRLSGLLRGQAGTEAAGAVPWPSGTRAVLLDAALVPLTAGLSDLGRTVLYRIGRADRDQGDAMVREITATAAGTALAPYAPVHLSAARTAAGVTFAWVRRTRIDGDNWAPVEVPLGEASELYRVEILAGGGVVRVLEAAAPSCLYPAAAELADFGAPQAALTVRVAQLSAVLGAGAPATATFSL
ncbi:baseplate multidomain protein megatron [Azorhizobium doebereinerae]|uniref:baseplate multidomain protein megatron n=1 Tax=Azorhizobium doebereinerae TaxID=281091 RepID=UPI0004084536|nr:glycoside hydrolase/phage tail family protein [Azorhizobium doebereinerae]